MRVTWRDGSGLRRRGGFVGRFDRPTPRVLGYRDHHDGERWSVEDLRQMMGMPAAK
jgi:hypothetical protein